jgi:DNA topoisomerase VI subunit A
MSDDIKKLQDEIDYLRLQKKIVANELELIAIEQMKLNLDALQNYALRTFGPSSFLFWF